MLKLVLCLISALLVAVLVLQLRQQRLEINHQALEYHNEIEAQQAKLWNQQLQIAVFTAPNAIAQTVGDQDLHMVPQAPLPARTAHWVETPTSPDAE
jgi:cell division protein FtsL